MEALKLTSKSKNLKRLDHQKSPVSSITVLHAGEHDSSGLVVQGRTVGATNQLKHEDNRTSVTSDTSLQNNVSSLLNNNNKD